MPRWPLKVVAARGASSTADRSSSSITRSLPLEAKSSNRATPRSKRSSWRAPAAAASRWRRHDAEVSRLLTCSGHLVGELAADAHRGRRKLVLGIVGGLAVLVWFAAAAPNDAAKDAGAVIALFLIFFPNIVGWWSIGNLNRLRPGFPFYLHYTRPVRTAVLVGVPMAYGAAVPAASYLVSALLLRVTTGYPFPLGPSPRGSRPSTWPMPRRTGRSATRSSNCWETLLSAWPG